MTSILDQLVKELNGARLRGGQRDVPSGNPSTLQYSGPTGLFSAYGVDRDVISTRVHPMGIADSIPAVPTIYTNPLYGFFTGFQDVTGNVANGICDDPQTAGPGKLCRTTAQFGRYSYQTRELEITSVGRQSDRSVPIDLNILNDPLLAGGAMTTPSVNGNPNLRQEFLMRMVEVGVAFQNKVGPQVFIGNPANNSVGGGYREFPGLDILIGTGKVDAITNQACPSLDSDIKNFNYQMVDVASGEGIVRTLTYMLRYLKHNASRMKFNPVTWAVVMREELFYELTAVWPCNYLTYRCIFPSAASQAQLTIDGTAQVEMRDAMRNGNFLVIDGIQYDVLFDDGIVEENRADNGAIGITSFASDIYIIPMTIRGGFRATYWEYFDYNNGPMDVVAQANGLGNFYWTDGGRYMWHQKPPNNFCVQQLAVMEPRLILRTPQLAGRLLNVQYNPLQHTRDSYPGDPYFVDGGVTHGVAGPSYYNEW